MQLGAEAEQSSLRLIPIIYPNCVALPPSKSLAALCVHCDSHTAIFPLALSVRMRTAHAESHAPTPFLSPFASVSALSHSSPVSIEHLPLQQKN